MNPWEAFDELAELLDGLFGEGLRLGIALAGGGDAVLDGFEAVVEPGRLGDDAGDGVAFADAAGEVKQFP